MEGTKGRPKQVHSGTPRLYEPSEPLGENRAARPGKRCDTVAHPITDV